MGDSGRRYVNSCFNVGVSKLKIMSRQNYFQQSLSNFTLEAASGGAIRHLADLGLSAKQISEKLTFPTPFELVKRILWQQLIDTKVVLLEEPGSGKQYEKPVYTVDRDKFGRTSFRLITPKNETGERVNWREPADFLAWKGHGGRAEELAFLLSEKCKANGEKEAYASCSFGQYSRKAYDAVLEVLNEKQREYISGLLWEPGICYHRLDGRMREIMIRLYAAGAYQGSCYFLKLKEKIEI